MAGKVCETEEERKILGESSLVITRGEGPEAERSPPGGRDQKLSPAHPGEGPEAEHRPPGGGRDRKLGTAVRRGQAGAAF